jgi:hypothetical protein
MKKIFLSALVATVAVGGAFLFQGEAKASGKVTRVAGIYYDPAESCKLVDCTGTGQDCSIPFISLPTTRTGVEGNYTCTQNVELVTGQRN